MSTGRASLSKVMLASRDADPGDTGLQVAAKFTRQFGGGKEEYFEFFFEKAVVVGHGWAPSGPQGMGVYTESAESIATR